MRSTALAFLLVLLAVSQSSAQVYIGDSGPTWNGACDNSCPQSTPCHLASSTGVLSPCVLYFSSGLTIPASTLSANFAGNMTLSSLGEVSFGSAITIANPSGGVVLQDFLSRGPSKVTFASNEVFIVDSSVTITDSSQIEFFQSSTVNIHRSNFSSNAQTFLCNDLIAGTVVDLSEVNLVTASGVSQVTDNSPGDEPSLSIRHSHITGFALSASQFTSVTLENVIATMTTSVNSVFDLPPSNTLSITDSNITSTANAWLVSAGASATPTMNIVRSHLVNVAFRASVQTLNLESSTFTLDELYDPVLLVSSLSTFTVRNAEIATRTASGSATTLSSFASGFALIWDVSNLVYNSPSTVPRMRLASATVVLDVRGSFTFPSWDVDDSGLDIYGSGPFGFSGDLTTPKSSVLFTFPQNPTLYFNSISIGAGFDIRCAGAPAIVYTATDPENGIRCKGGPGCLTLPSNPIAVVWDSSRPLPIANELYPFVNSSNAVYTFNSQSSEFTLTSSNANSISFFAFQEVPCASNCVAANSGPCVSQTRCTCKPGYEGVNCEISPPVAAPVEISPPTSIPVEISPVSSPTSTPENSPSLSIPSSTPSSAPTSTPSTGNPPSSSPTSTPSAGNPPSTNPPSNAPSDSPTQSPGSVPMSIPSSGIPVSNTPDTPTSNASQHLSSWIISFVLVSTLLIWF